VASFGQGVKSNGKAATSLSPEAKSLFYDANKGGCYSPPIQTRVTVRQLPAYFFRRLYHMQILLAGGRGSLRVDRGSVHIG